MLGSGCQRTNAETQPGVNTQPQQNQNTRLQTKHSHRERRSALLPEKPQYSNSGHAWSGCSGGSVLERRKCAATMGRRAINGTSGIPVCRPLCSKDAPVRHTCLLAHNGKMPSESGARAHTTRNTHTYPVHWQQWRARWTDRLSNGAEAFALEALSVKLINCETVIPNAGARENTSKVMDSISSSDKPSMHVSNRLCSRSLIDVAIPLQAQCAATNTSCVLANPEAIGPHTGRDELTWLPAGKMPWVGYC
jgi:hypothetical protein